MLLNALKTSALDESTIVFISADHGGSGKTHGANDLRSLHIPWIMSGPGVRKHFDLTSIRELTVRTTDTFATACYILGIELPDGIEGKPIVQAFEEVELLTSVRPATRDSLPTTGESHR
jgi:arylsulfatase A-like enzyme